MQRRDVLHTVAGGLGLTGTDRLLDTDDDDNSSDTDDQTDELITFDDDPHDTEYGPQHDDPLDRFARVLATVGNVNPAVSSADEGYNQSIYTVGIDGSTLDLYGTSYANYSNTFVNTDNIEAQYREVADAITNELENMVWNGMTPPGDEAVVYAGLTGRNNSFLPMTFTLEQHGDIVSITSPDEAYDQLRLEAGEAVDDLTAGQHAALQQLGGFDDTYDHHNRLIITENLDGIPHNNWSDGGEFELDGAPAELIDTEENNRDWTAAIRTGAGDNPTYDHDVTLGDTVQVGDHTLTITRIAPYPSYIEAEVTHGNYHLLDNTPFPQVDDPLDSY